MSLEPVFDRLVVASVPRDVVVMTGPEAGSYLHGQISADVAAMAPGDSTLSFLLEPRGRVEALFGICRAGPDTYVADTEPGFGEAMAVSLERFKLRTRADFELQQWHMHAVRSPHSTKGSAASAMATGPADAPEHVMRPTNWPLASGYDVLARPESVTGGNGDGAERLSADEFETLRMAFGLPAMGLEIRPGDIPNETGLVELAASFTKGCYRGQELVERIDSRSGGRRILRRVRSEFALEADEQLFNTEGIPVATLRSTASLGEITVGYALARRDAADELHTVSGNPVLLAAI